MTETAAIKSIQEALEALDVPAPPAQASSLPEPDQVSEATAELDQVASGLQRAQVQAQEQKAVRIARDLGRAQRREAREAARAARSAAPLAFCLCGCGQTVRSRKAKFLPGHDRKLYSLLEKIEKGEQEEGAVPLATRSFLANCGACGRLIIPHPSGLGPICRKKIGSKAGQQ